MGVRDIIYESRLNTDDITKIYHENKILSKYEYYMHVKIIFIS